MKDAIQTILAGTQGAKVNTQQLCIAMVDVIRGMSSQSQTMNQFEVNEAIDQFAKSEFAKKYGSEEPLSWHSMAVQLGSNSTNAKYGDICKLRLDRYA